MNPVRGCSKDVHRRLVSELARGLGIGDKKPIVEAAVDQDSLTGNFWDRDIHARGHETPAQVARRLETEKKRVARMMAVDRESPETAKALGRLSHMTADYHAHQLKTRHWERGRELARGNHPLGFAVNIVEHLRQPDIDRLDKGAIAGQRQLAKELKVMEKSAAFEAGFTSAMEKLALSPHLLGKAMAMRTIQGKLTPGRAKAYGNAIRQNYFRGHFAGYPEGLQRAVSGGAMAGGMEMMGRMG